MHDIPVIILCGGAGTRLRKVVKDVPKPLAPINKSQPFLSHLIKSFCRQGLRKVVLSTHYKKEFFHDFLRNFQFEDGSEIEIVEEDSPLGTGGAVKHVLGKLKTKSLPVFIANGDTYIESGVQELFKKYQENSSHGYLSLIKMSNCDRYGTVDREPNSQIVSFKEKEETQQSGFINCGFGLFNSEHFDLVDKEKFSLEKDLYPLLCKDGKLSGVEIEKPFIDIGIPEDYKKFQEWIGAKSD